jgi:tetraacyldisaccharide 4'-kinase
MRRPWLAPIMPFYAAGLAWRNLRLHRGWEQVRRLRRDVISVGALSAGGSGKTPFAIALAKALAARGLDVDVLSRGYGRLGSEPARVDPLGTAEEFGDEPLLIADAAGVPVYVASRRYDAGILAEKVAEKDEPAPESVGSTTDPRPRVHILDDGFQHRQLFRVVDILLLDPSDFNDFLLPAGNLREPLSAALRATVVAIPASNPRFERELRTRGWKGPLWRLRRHVSVPRLPGPSVAFCGIARPEQFFSALSAGGADLTRRIAFADHHRYTRQDLRRLEAAAGRSAATAFLTTEKDRVRMGELKPELPLFTAGLEIEIEDESGVLGWLMERLADTASRRNL